MKEIQLIAEDRTTEGKGSARQTRMKGLVPAIIYGPDFKPKTISGWFASTLAFLLIKKFLVEIYLNSPNAQFAF